MMSEVEASTLTEREKKLGLHLRPFSASALLWSYVDFTHETIIISSFICIEPLVGFEDESFQSIFASFSFSVLQEDNLHKILSTWKKRISPKHV